LILIKVASAVAVGADIEPVLRRERVARRRTAQAHAENPPPWISGEQRLRVAGQMGPRKNADTEMDDSGRDARWVKSRPPFQARERIP
jgi:hypothetical protein